MIQISHLSIESHVRPTCHTSPTLWHHPHTAHYTTAVPSRGLDPRGAPSNRRNPRPMQGRLSSPGIKLVIKVECLDFEPLALILYYLTFR